MKPTTCRAKTSTGAPCRNPIHVHIAGLCKSHYNNAIRLRNAANLQSTRAAYKPQPCSQGCAAPALARGLCKSHYRAYLRLAYPENLNVTAWKTCKAFGCEGYAPAGFCGWHLLHALPERAAAR